MSLNIEAMEDLVIHSDEYKTNSEVVLNKLKIATEDFKNLSHKANRVLDLKDVKHEVLSKGTISRDDASYVQKVYKDLLNDKVRLAEFTLQPSKTNFSYVSNFMHNKLALEEEDLISCKADIIKSNTDAINESISYIDANLDDAFSALENLKMLVTSLDKLDIKAGVIEASKNLLVPYGDSIINVFKMNIRDIDLSKSPVEFKDKDKLIISINKIAEISTNKYFLFYIFISGDNKSIDDLYHSYSNIDVDSEVLTIESLAKFSRSNTSVILLNLLITNLKEKFDSYLKNNDLKEETTNDVKSITNEEQTLEELFNIASAIVSIVSNINGSSQHIVNILNMYHDLKS